ncbi:MAG: chalcone isomerase family protein [Rubricoccaceae bacterium]|nr:chalcone isomerase family protein [Rubricoccaceae bacterium]
MKTIQLCSTAILTIVLGLGTVHAKECEGVSFPEQMKSEGVALKLNGLGLRQATIFNVDVYVAALYVTQPSKDANAILKSAAPKELILHFVRDVGSSDLSKGWHEGFENNAKSQLPALKDRIEAFKGMMTDVKKGEVLRLTYKPGAGVRVEVNKAVKGTIKGDDFAQALFSIWLGPNPPNAGLKTGLLGGSCG